ncbi:MAG: hypothetical protein LBM20_08850 [Rikenellaceae bacterium]|jgi:hypothetical protein|nr:hypothetical protein [Rikenellaceae bacterium]
MKKIILTLLTVIVVALAFSSCGPYMHKSQSSGQDNVSYIIVLKETGEYNNVSVVVDDKTYPYDKIYKVKAKRKAHPVTIEPGRHHLKVIVDGAVMTDENIFIGLQETKTIVLR